MCVSVGIFGLNPSVLKILEIFTKTSIPYNVYTARACNAAITLSKVVKYYQLSSTKSIFKPSYVELVI